MHLDYSVSFNDFKESMKAYRRRARGAAFVYYLDVWVLPVLGVIVVCWFLYSYLNHDEDLISTLQFLAVIGVLAAVGLPLLYRLQLKRIYKQRISLSKDGRVSLDIDENMIRFHLSDKADVKLYWNAFTDYSESNGVVTLFMDKAAFNTIPKREVSEADWAEFLKMINTHLRKR